jgi:peptidoglycan/LPS O-acetylase OafA/YrhL
MAKVQTNFSEPLHYNGERFSALAGKPLQLLGEISFSIHLAHWIVIVLVTNALLVVLTGFRLAPELFWAALAILVISLTVPFHTHRIAD